MHTNFWKRSFALTLAGIMSVLCMNAAHAQAFDPPISYGVGPGTGPTVSSGADLDGDGDLDLAIGITDNNTVAILLNDGEGAYSFVGDVAVGLDPLGIAAADFDGDGDQDLAVANFLSNTVSVLLNHGGGTFDPAVHYNFVGSRPNAIVAADFDEDGFPDLAVANRSSNDVSILLNGQDGTFSLAGTHEVGTGPSVIRAADLNGDDCLDLVTTDFLSFTVSVLLSAGNGDFAPASKHETNLDYPLGMAISDLDADGDLDIATTIHREDKVLILFNDGTGSFVTDVFPSGSQFPTAIVSADFDGDGDDDLAFQAGPNAASGIGGLIRVYLNQGDGSFVFDQAYDAGSGGGETLAGDLDMDGDIDLAQPNHPGNTVSILLNRTILVESAEDIACGLIGEAVEAVANLPLTSVTTRGNQTALQQFLKQACKFLQNGDTSKAIRRLEKALSHTDGCGLRGLPDAGKMRRGQPPAKDYVNDCNAQGLVYPLIRDALDVIGS